MNWGTKLVIGMVVFMLFILGMVFYMFKVNDSDSLVDENYYEKGIEYDKEYVAKQNVFADQVEPQISKDKGVLIIKMHQDSKYQLKLIRPADAKLDQTIMGETTVTNREIKVPIEKLATGLWSIRLEWQFNGKNYLFVKEKML